MPRVKIDRKEIERLQKKYGLPVGCGNDFKPSYTMSGEPYKNRPDYSLRVVWWGMVHRCGKLHYQNISICDEWLTFETFKEWAMDNKWEKGKHLHRVDNAGNYKPDNVVIITAREHGLVHKIPSG